MADPLTANEREPGTRSCPTCHGNGTQYRQFDGFCPAAWAHCYLGTLNLVEQQREQIAELRQQVSQLQADVTMALDALREMGSAATYTVEAIEGEATSDATPLEPARSYVRHAGLRVETSR